MNKNIGIYLLNQELDAHNIEPEMEGQSANSPQDDVKFRPNNYSDSEDENLTVRTKKWCQRTFTIHLLKQRLPILQWMPHYTLKSAFRDCLAGFTVALTAIPQGIAYGAVAGLPVEVFIN